MVNEPVTGWERGHDGICFVNIYGPVCLADEEIRVRRQEEREAARRGRFDLAYIEEFAHRTQDPNRMRHCGVMTFM